MITENPVTQAIKSRRSIRHFTEEPVCDEEIDQIIESGMWAPSGKNNQPWKFAVIQDTGLRASLTPLTHYGSIIQSASVCIAVFLDHSRVYDRTKDIQAAGAAIQNMLLTIHSLGLGGVWLGEILKNKEKVGESLGAGRELELMAVIALGHPKEKAGRQRRDHLEERVFLRK